MIIILKGDCLSVLVHMHAYRHTDVLLILGSLNARVHGGVFVNDDDDRRKHQRK